VYHTISEEASMKIGRAAAVKEIRSRRFLKDSGNFVGVFDRSDF